MRKLVIILSVLLQGCIYQITSATDIKAAVQYCKDKGGVEYIRVEFDGSEYAICNSANPKRMSLDSYIKEQFLNDQ